MQIYLNLLFILEFIFFCFLKNSQSLLGLLQLKNDDTVIYDYPQIMLELFQNFYLLPNKQSKTMPVPIDHRRDIDVEENNRNSKYSFYPNDELFVWSLLLYSGKESDLNLIRYYWSNCKQPIACCIIAVILFNRLQAKSYIPNDLKEQMMLTSK